MIHAREDYNRIQDPKNHIGENEPVFLLRAKDISAPATVEKWAELNRLHGGDPELTRLAQNQAQAMRVWQSVYGCKAADYRGEPMCEACGEEVKPAYSFSEALHWMKQGKKMARTGWNGKNMFVYLVQGSTFNVNRAPLLGIFPEGTEVTYRPHLDMKYADGTFGVWLASQSDILADDWVMVE
jgi:hypothetical protein